MNSNQPSEQLRDDALAIWKAGVAAVDSRKAVAQQIRLDDDTLHIADQAFARSDIDRVIVVGAGKASGWMAAGFEDAISHVDAGFLDRYVVGHVNVPDDQEITLRSIKIVGCRPAGENLPGPRVLSGTQQILDLVRSATERDLVVFMVAGGGSALLEQPVAPVTLDDFRAVTTMLSAGGAAIGELNAVRRAISQVKAGGLARNCKAGNLVALIVSDVIGDPIEIIASGPTVVESDQANLLNPVDVLKQFDPSGELTPPSVREVIASAQPDQLAAPSCKIHNQILCNNQTAVAAAQAKAIELGYQVVRAETSASDADAETVGEDLGRELVQVSAQAGKRCVISGGEPTVKLGARPGRGGRSQHVALSGLSYLDARVDTLEADYCFLSGGTDGEDGNVPVAGAWFDSSTKYDGALLLASLASFDSYSFWEEVGTLIRVPPTRTNVCDLRVILTSS